MIDRRFFLASAAACLTSPLWMSSVSADETPALRLAFVPQESPEKLLGDIEVVTKWLSEQMGTPVEGFVTFDYAAAVEALRNGEADISFMGALPFVLAEKQVGAVPLLSEVYRGQASYSGRVFVRKDSGIKTLSDLKGKDIAFADPVSESGYLYPLDLFVQAGLFESASAADGFFGNSFFAGGYQQAIQAMVNGFVDAAGTSQYSDLFLTPEQQREITVIAESAQIPGHAVVARPGLDSAVQARFVEVMLSLNAAEHRPFLQYLYGPDGYVLSDPAVYEGVRAMARRYGYL